MKLIFALSLPNERKSKFVLIPGAGSYSKRHSRGEGGQKLVKSCLRSLWMVPESDVSSAKSDVSSEMSDESSAKPDISMTKQA